MGAIAIQIAHADGRSERRPLDEGSYHIGREGGEIILPDPDVSSRHARLDVRGGAVSVTDLGSTNGTLDASGTRIATSHVLRPNQPIQLGRSKISVVSGQAPPRGGRTRVMPQFVQPESTSPAPPAPLPARAERKLGLFAKATQVSRGLVTNEQAWTSTTTTQTTSYGANGSSWTSYSVTSHYWQRIWYQLDSGRDVSWTFCDANIELLRGHRVAVIYDVATNKALRFVNCSTRYFWRIGMPNYGVVSRFFRRIGALIVAAFFMFPLFNAFGALIWLREAFGRTGRWYSGVLLKLLAVSFLLAVVGSYTWALAMVSHATAHDASAFALPAEGVAQIEKLLARVVASDLFSSLAPLTGSKEADIARMAQRAQLELRDAAWLSEEAFIAKYRIQAISVGSERFATHIAVPLSVLCSVLVFVLGAALFQLQLTMHYWFARSLDKQSNAEMN